MVGIAPSAVNTEMQKQALDGAITADVSLCHENWGGCDDGSIFIILAKQVVNQTGATNTGLLEPEEVSKEFLFDKLSNCWNVLFLLHLFLALLREQRSEIVHLGSLTRLMHFLSFASLYVIKYHVYIFISFRLV